MPPRWLCVMIVAAWLASTGWLFFHDLLPRLLPGQSPPYDIEIVEEAQTTHTHANWTIDKEGIRVAESKTRVSQPSTGIFELISEITPAAKKTADGRLVPQEPIPPFPAEGILVQKLVSVYRIDEAGDLAGLSATVEGNAEIPAFLGSEVNLTLQGEVSRGRLTTRLQGERWGVQRTSTKLALDLPVLRIGSGESIVMPLHPVNRHRGLVPGQTWQVHLFDPLAFSRQGIGAVQGLAADLPMLQARVRPEEARRRNARDGEFPCLVIDYEGDHVQINTWVSRKTGLVVFQEATLDRVRWELKRE